MKMPIANIGKVTGDGCGRGHHRANQVGAPTPTLSAFKIAVAGGGAALSRLKDIGIHAQAHGTTRFTPLETGIHEYSVQAFLLGGTLDRL